MNFRSFSPAIPRIAAAAAFLMSAASASAYDWGDGFSLQKKEGDEYAIIASPYTRHYTEDPAHRHVWLVGVERKRENNDIAGIAFFSNSFGQRSAYYFPWGRMYPELFGQPQLYAKVTAGLLYGYTGIYQHKVPFNHDGFSPAIIPALGWQLGDGFQVQANFLGLNGLMLQFTLPLQ